MKIDSISVSDEIEATKLMIHHLHIAAMLFEATHDDEGVSAKELILQQAPLEHSAMNSFVTALVLAYEGMAE